mgnify:CR=1 FL=1
MKSIELNIQDALKFAEKEYDAMGPEAVAALKLSLIHISEPTRP